MSTTNDGGPAFPVPVGAATLNGEWTYAEPGMSLRDWFAGKALQGLLATPTTSGGADAYAYQAYLHADAMLRARKAKA